MYVGTYLGHRWGMREEVKEGEEEEEDTVGTHGTFHFKDLWAHPRLRVLCQGARGIPNVIRGGERDVQAELGDKGEARFLENTKQKIGRERSLAERQFYT